MKHQPFSRLICLILVVLLLAACSPNSPMLPANDYRIISSGSSFGQSFTAQNSGLSGVSVLLAPYLSQSSGSLLFHLRTSPQSNDDIARASLPLSEITHQTYYKFDFTPQNDSQRKDYFLQVDIEDGGQVQILTAAADSYLDGALYENQVPQEAQLGFRLEYDGKAYLLGLIQLAIKWAGVLVLGLFVFILPGWALFSLLWRGWDDLNWGSKLGLSGGLSLAIYPLLLLWTGLVGLHLGPIYAWLPAIAGLLALVWKNRKSITQIRLLKRQKNNLFSAHKIPPAEVLLPDITFIVILGLLVVSRFWVIRSLDVPLFGDSYQHTMITQLIIDHGGLFNSWEPYADLITFTYHFGFHTAAAVYHWISGASAARAVLWTGQLVNILAILGLYPLAFKITKNRWAGVIAMLVAGLLTPMPMSYVNWGRFTQLAGQAVLPAVIWTAWSLLERPFPTLQNIPWMRKLINWRYLSLDLGSLAIVWLSLGGIALTHYRILILIILFFPAYALLAIDRRCFLSVLSRIAWIGVGGAILFAPWFIHVFGGKILEIFAIQITTLPSAMSTTAEQINTITDFQYYLPIYIWILFVLCVGWGFWKRKKELMIFTLWWFFIVLATNPNWIGLPGAGVITNFAIFIALYIPASVAIGSAIAWILRNPLNLGNLDSSTYKSKIFTLLVPGLALVVIFSIGIWGVPKRLKDLNIPTYALVTRPDIRAMAWIQGNTEPDTQFIINSFSTVGDSSIVGSDGGWWLPLLAHRKSNVPPLTYVAEQGASPNYQQEVNNLFNEIKSKGINNIEVIQQLIEHQFSYIYIGQLQGRVHNPDPALLDPTSIDADSHFELVYHQDRVWIFKIRP